MTRQCAWCNDYFSLDSSQPYVTHGICDDCAEQIRHSMQEENTPRSGGLFTAARATLAQVFHLR